MKKLILKKWKILGVWIDSVATDFIPHLIPQWVIVFCFHNDWTQGVIKVDIDWEIKEIEFVLKEYILHCKK